MLHVLIDSPTSAAYRILKELAGQRGFDWAELVRRVEMSARHSPGREADFSFRDDFGHDVRLGSEMLIVLDEGLNVSMETPSPSCA